MDLAHDPFIHVRIIIGIVTGPTVTRLLTGLTRFVQHPVRDRIYLVHLAWTLFLLLAIVHFWWFEFGLQRIGAWTFEIYLFVICYAALFFFLGALLFPNRMDEYAGFAEYFHSRQKWFYGLLARLFLADLIDTAIKGAGHFSAFGRRLSDPARHARRLGVHRHVHRRPALSRRLRGGRDRGRGQLDREPVRGAGVNIRARGCQNLMAVPSPISSDW